MKLIITLTENNLTWTTNLISVYCYEGKTEIHVFNSNERNKQKI